MADIENSELLNASLKALFITVARRTSYKFASAFIESIIINMEEKFDFLKDIQIHTDNNHEDFVVISSDLNSVHPVRIGKVIEFVIQVVLIDLKDRAGHYFIKEVKKNLKDEILYKLKECGVDFELIMLQQHYLFFRQAKNKNKSRVDDDIKIKNQSLDNINLLNYSENNISSWSYDSKNRVCIIYGNDGKVLDRINLDAIVKNYLGSLTNNGLNEPLKDLRFKEKGENIEISEKELELLKLLYAKDIDIETAIEILKISENELNYMVKRLLTLDMLDYISSDEVSLTDIGINRLKAKIGN
jgi:hypothetical protein